MWELIKWFLTGWFSSKIILFGILALVWLPQAGCRLPVLKSCRDEHTPSLHNYYQPGDLIIGYIISQIYMSSYQITFTKHPSQDVGDELMYGARF